MKQTNVINNQNSQEHVVEPYRFKIFGANDNESAEQKVIQDENPITQTKQPQQTDISQEEQNDFIKELLNRTNELNQSIINLQTQIQNQENQFKDRLDHEIAMVRNEAIKEGQEQQKQKTQLELDGVKQKYINSIQKLDEQINKLNLLYEKSQADLANTAIDIAKQVIAKELSQNSAQVALNIAKSIIYELQNATNISIKANPKDLEYIKENLKADLKVRILSDDAISIGGVMVLSDSGNIDGNVIERFNKIKRVLSE